MFMTETSPNHWCWIPELENLTDIDRRSLAIPPDTSAKLGYSHCHAYVANWTDVLNTGQRPNQSWPTTQCLHGWEFNKSEIPYVTISSEQGWVCDKNNYQATAQSFYFIGSIAGGFIFGWVADRYGRLAATIGTNLLGCITGILAVFARNIVQFTIFRFLAGMAYDNCMMMVYLLVMEYVAPKYRTRMANLSSGLFYTLSMTSLPWIALACNDWKTLGIATSAPMALALLAPLILPESPRWLLGKGRIDEAVQKVVTIARINKKKIPIELINSFKTSFTEDIVEENATIIEVLKRPLLRKAFICMCIDYLCCSVVFDGLVRSIGVLPFNFFVSFTLTSFTELPSLLLVVFLLDKLGRKWLTIICTGLCSITSILTAFTTGYVSLCSAISARLFINMACYTTIQWTAEILPTSVRGSGFSIVHIFGFIGYVLSPYIVYLENIVPGLPLIILGCFIAIATVSTFNIPETTNIDMPHSFEDAEELIRSQKFFDIPCLRKENNDDIKEK
ncbi:carcinine transporter-like [Epargyreus clarus]|uniref:carcinine transporter-like n=1 Tax=Epargyreus clarus TaxID=520877 RepID=UPI003C2F6C89